MQLEYLLYPLTQFFSRLGPALYPERGPTTNRHATVALREDRGFSVYKRQPEDSTPLVTESRARLLLNRLLGQSLLDRSERYCPSSYLLRPRNYGFLELSSRIQEMID